MAEKKISTIILKVDLECTRCYKKISKTICKIQEKENIQTIVFDEKSNTVTISGPFDPKKVIKKLCCNACKVIKDIQVKDGKEKEKEKPKDAKAAAEPTKDKPKDAKPAAEPAKDDKPKDKSKDAKPADEPKKDKPKDAKPAAEPAKDTEPPKDKPKALESYPPAPEPGFFTIHEPRFNYQPVWGGPVCDCGGRQYDGYYGESRGCWCGRGSSWAQGGPMGPPPVVYGQPVYGGAYKTQNYFCEENPESCGIM